MITQQSIEQVKAAIQIEDVIQEHVALKKSGSTYKAPCPFHQEKTASFHVSPQKGIYKCYGCGAGGDALKFIMHHKQINYPDAIRLMAKKYNISLEETAHNAEDKIVAEKKELLYNINTGVANYYQQCLKDILQNQPDHWVTRHLHEERNFSDETIIDFKLGYAPDSWDFITSKYTESEHRTAAKELGLIKESKGKTYDAFRDRLMFPFIDRMGRITGFTGRKNPACQNDDNPKYFNSPDSMVFKKAKQLYGVHTAEVQIRKSSTVYLTEGQADVCQMQQNGMLNTICASGTAFTEDHAQELKRFCKTVVIVADGDAAGLKSTMRTIDILLENGLHPEVVRLPDGQDPDSFIRQKQQELELKALTV